MRRRGAVLFDMDDTLYDEMTFVTAAFGEVAALVGGIAGDPEDVLLAEMVDILSSHGRGRVFDLLLERRELPLSWVLPMLHVYRSARPQLRLYDDGVALLEALRSRGIPTGIVTDGCALVQASKVAGLGVEGHVDVVIYTDLLGRDAGKPAVTGFVAAVDMLGADTSASTYVANDVRKDFVGPRELGMTGILVTRGILGTLDEQPASAHPDHVVNDLAEVGPLLGVPARPLG